MADDTVLVHRLRQGPWPGGSLCLTGDCPNCLATVDGITYTRTCQTPHREGQHVVPHPSHDHLPPLDGTGARDAVATRTIHCDVVVIGQGPAGTAAAAAARAQGRHVETLDAAQGQEAVGIYPGPLVVARTDDGVRRLYPRIEIVVATGAAEIQPIVPGSDLAGILTRGAAERLAEAGVPLGQVVAVGAPPAHVPCTAVPGTLVRFEPHAHESRRVGAVIVRDDAGVEHRHSCDTAVIFLGLTPRDALVRMSRGMPVRAVGDVTRAPDLPPAPEHGVICPCLGTTVDDVRSVHARGFTDLELVKRATLAGTGPCQGSVCVPHLRAFLQSTGATLQPPFTARPLTRQLTMAEAAAGWHHVATPRTALDAEHRALGAQMERLGGWWRPWHYGDTDEEYRAVRNAVSICDVSTLGKMIVSGPDVVRLLEHLYPVPIASLKPGRSKYVLLLDERGYVMDDGMVNRDSETRFTLTFTSGGSTHAELWVRDWAESLECDVRIMNVTQALGAINLTGPRATELLQRAGVTTPPAFMQHTRAAVAGVDCRIYRLSFTGEVSYELHHAAHDSVRLWRALLDLGRDLGIRPHGLEALMRLRLEKGHLIVGQDTEFDSTPRRLNHEWAVRMDKPAFVGRQAILRTNLQTLDKQLCGLTMDGPPPAEGTTIWRDGVFAGYVTSAAWSPTLGRSVLLGWLRLNNGILPNHVTIDGRPAEQAVTPFYDPEGHRARA